MLPYHHSCSEWAKKKSLVTIWKHYEEKNFFHHSFKKKGQRNLDYPVKEGVRQNQIRKDETVYKDIKWDWWGCLGIGLCVFFKPTTLQMIKKNPKRIVRSILLEPPHQIQTTSKEINKNWIACLLANEEHFLCYSQQSFSKPSVLVTNFSFPYLQRGRKCSIIRKEGLCNTSQSVCAYMERFQIVLGFLIREV